MAWCPTGAHEVGRRITAGSNTHLLFVGEVHFIVAEAVNIAFFDATGL